VLSFVRTWTLWGPDIGQVLLQKQGPLTPVTFALVIRPVSFCFECLFQLFSMGLDFIGLICPKTVLGEAVSCLLRVVTWTRDVLHPLLQPGGSLPVEPRPPTSGHRVPMLASHLQSHGVHLDCPGTGNATAGSLLLTCHSTQELCLLFME
jgi:hypothetical protein